MIDNAATVVSLTDAAAGKLREITADEPNPAAGLRVYVYSGGCSGFRYGMMIEDAPTAEDPGDAGAGSKNDSVPHHAAFGSNPNPGRPPGRRTERARPGIVAWTRAAGPQRPKRRARC